MGTEVFEVSEFTKIALHEQLASIGAGVCPLCAKPLLDHDRWFEGSTRAGVCPCCIAHMEIGPDCVGWVASPVQTGPCEHERSGKNGPWVTPRMVLVGRRAEMDVDTPRAKALEALGDE